MVSQRTSGPAVNHQQEFSRREREGERDIEKEKGGVKKSKYVEREKENDGVTELIK